MTSILNARKTAFVWLLGISVLVTLAWLKHATIDTSMMSLLPASEQQPLVRDASAQMGRQFSQRLLILVSAEDKQTRQNAMTQLAGAFEPLPQVASVVWKMDANTLEAAQQALFPYRYVLLSDDIVTAITQQQTGRIRQQALSQVLNPVGMGKLDLVADPFGLQQNWQLQQSFPIKMRLEDGFLHLTTAESTYLVVLNLADDAFSMKTQRAVLDVYERWQKQLNTRGVTLQVSGLLIHADAGAKQAQQEMSTIGLGSLLGIVVLMLWVFRRVSTVMLLILPVAVGCIVATATTFLLFEQVHIVTFAFGAGLIGVAIDYALHYLCERQVRRDVLRHILPGLTLGLVSSVLAYAAQAIAPFPGLRQMALFSVVGLIAAWLTVVLWFPLLIAREPTFRTSAGHMLMKWQRFFPSTQRQPWLFPLLIVLGCVSVIVIFLGKAEDDIRLLQTSPPALIKQETQVQQLLGLNSSTQFLMVRCEQVQACLEKEESLKPVLDKWLQDDKISHYRMLSTRIPSLSRQQEHAHLTSVLYANELDKLFQTLGLPEAVYHEATVKLETDLNKRLLPGQEDAPLTMQTSPLVVTEHDGMATVISFDAQKALTDSDLSELNQQVNDVVLVDQVEAISSLMHSYRQQMMVWVALAYLVVMAILLGRYKTAVWQIILPPLLASLFTMAILMTVLPGINLFHVMALILVLGIGIDMGIFLTETQQAEHTWLAVTLSVVTSLMAFGLLAWSQTPVLKHFGMTVLLGLSFVWIVATLMRQTVVGSKNIAGSSGTL